MGDIGSIPGSGRYPGGGNGNPLLAWEISWTKDIMGSQGVGYDLVTEQQQQKQQHISIKLKKWKFSWEASLELELM